MILVYEVGVMVSCIGTCELNLLTLETLGDL